MAIYSTTRRDEKKRSFVSYSLRSMDYKRYHNEVITMQRRMRDWLDLPTHSEARSLEQAFQRLEDDVQVNKNVHTIRDDLKRLESLMTNLDEAVMSHGHRDELVDWVRDSLQNVR